MFRNQYDTDCITWSPAGRIHQIEYAMEAVKQGSAAVGLRSKTHALVASIKKSSNELSSYQKKIFKIDEHMGIAIAGLVPDGRVLAKYMRSECLNYRFVYDGPLQVGRLVAQVADKSQLGTQRAGHRPYGVGLLVAGYDQTGPHIFQTCPSGNFWEYHAFAIGARAHAAAGAGARPVAERARRACARLAAVQRARCAVLGVHGGVAHAPQRSDARRAKPVGVPARALTRCAAGLRHLSRPRAAARGDAQARDRRRRARTSSAASRRSRSSRSTSLSCTRCSRCARRSRPAPS